jgi:hypothetical protein
MLVGLDSAHAYYRYLYNSIDIYISMANLRYPAHKKLSWLIIPLIPKLVGG